GLGLFLVGRLFLFVLQLLLGLLGVGVGLVSVVIVEAFLVFVHAVAQSALAHVRPVSPGGQRLGWEGELAALRRVLVGLADDDSDRLGGHRSHSRCVSVAALDKPVQPLGKLRLKRAYELPVLVVHFKCIAVDTQVNAVAGG